MCTVVMSAKLLGRRLLGITESPPTPSGELFVIILLLTLSSVD